MNTQPTHPSSDSDKAYMAIDQYGQTYHIGFTKYPRQWLLNHFGRKSARKIYHDTLDGHTYHVGWIIGGLWLSVYEVKPMREAA